MNDELVTLDRLKTWLGYEKRGAVVRWLNENRVRWLPGKDGRPVTTVSAINAALSRDVDGDLDDIDFEGSNAA